jgi:hypothetical protein
MSGFRKATKSKSKLRAAISGPPGSGKSMSALRLATGMGGSIAAIDSEDGSIELYSDRFEFDVKTLDEKHRTVRDYVAAIREAGAAGYEVLIIDSLSHAWQELLDEVEKIAKAKYRGNTWSAWSEGTPIQKELTMAILTYPGHVIATMRTKIVYETSKDERTGKSNIQRIGLAPEQGKGIEYEFSVLFQIDQNHILTCVKDRTGKFQDRLIEKPGEELGQELAAWLNDGVELPNAELSRWFDLFQERVANRWTSLKEATPELSKFEKVPGLPFEPLHLLASTCAAAMSAQKIPAAEIGQTIPAIFKQLEPVFVREGAKGLEAIAMPLVQAAVEAAKAAVGSKAAPVAPAATTDDGALTLPAKTGVALFAILRREEAARKAKLVDAALKWAGNQGIEDPIQEWSRAHVSQYSAILAKSLAEMDAAAKQAEPQAVA